MDARPLVRTIGGEMQLSREERLRRVLDAGTRAMEDAIRAEWAVIEDDREDPSSVPGAEVKLPKRPLLWYPQAQSTEAVDMPTRGKYPKGFPEGLVVHYSSGAFAGGVQAAKNLNKWGAAQGYAYMSVGQDGVVVQDHPLDSWGQHCGVSTWPRLGASLSSRLVGLEIVNAGRVARQDNGEGKTWFGTVIPAGEIREIPTARYPGEVFGWYHAFTPEQERALVELCLWLKSQAPDIFQFENVVGHDELRNAAGRPGDKQDPGGSHSLGMVKLREQLKRLYVEGKLSP
jgi:N-acetyl-anhydromuramyl-L-alanine amidase AmpD